MKNLKDCGPGGQVFSTSALADMTLKCSQLQKLYFFNHLTAVDQIFIPYSISINTTTIDRDIKSLVPKGRQRTQR